MQRGCSPRSGTTTFRLLSSASDLMLNIVCRRRNTMPFNRVIPSTSIHLTSRIRGPSTTLFRSLYVRFQWGHSPTTIFPLPRCGGAFVGRVLRFGRRLLRVTNLSQDIGNTFTS